MNLAKITPGMTVADIGAGEGYYTVRLATRVGEKGRVLAQDIDASAVRRLGSRVERERLDNVSIKLGAPDDPRLPATSFDRIFLVHMYHEVAEPTPSCGGSIRRWTKAGRSSWSIPTGRRASTGSPRGCCFVNSRQWASAWSNLCVNQRLRAIMRSSKRRDRARHQAISSRAAHRRTLETRFELNARAVARD